MYFIGGQACRGANRVVVGENNMREMNVPVVLLLVDDHRQHLGHGVVNTLRPSVTARVV